jgi:phosphoribosyl-AMP cyclohydrolase
MKQFGQEEIDNFIKVMDFSKLGGGLIPVVAQDDETNEILMLAFANEEAVRKSLETGFAHYYSRSRQTLWKKGGTSGHVQRIKHVIIDCDNDSILFKVDQEGGACHKGKRSCFYNEYTEDGNMLFIGEDVFNPDDVYDNPE